MSGAGALRALYVERHYIEVNMEQFHGTTILCVRRGSQVALGGDGQVTLGNIVMKGTARKVRKLYQGKVLCGFAGGTADAFTLLDRFEAKLEKHQGNLLRASVELAKDWRTDRVLRRPLSLARTAGTCLPGHRRWTVQPRHLPRMLRRSSHDGQNRPAYRYSYQTPIIKLRNSYYALTKLPATLDYR
eukprot:gene39143-48344_t